MQEKVSGFMLIKINTILNVRKTNKVYSLSHLTDIGGCIFL